MATFARALLVLWLGGLPAMATSPPGPIEPLDSVTGRTADPQGDVRPVRTEEVRFRNGDDTLSGTLALPDTPGPHPAIAFVFGSGPADRTYNGMAPRLWRHFASHGFACLAWDKPGVG